MNRTILIAMAVALVTPLAAFADQTVLGIPDITCQSTSDWNVHDYGAPATGFLLFLPQDGNLDQCNPPYTYGWFLLSDEDCALLLEQLGGNTSDPVYVLLCLTDRPADWDGDLEFAFGGAYLIGANGDGTTSGGIACYDITEHHLQGQTVYVNDLVFPTVAFTVTADFTDPSDPQDPLEGPDCGDSTIQPCDPNPPGDSSLPEPVGGVVDTVNALLYSLFNSDGTTCTQGDVSKPCVDRCVLDFPPGVDGAYIVFVGPSLAGNNGEPTGATQGHVSTGNHPVIPPVIDEIPEIFTECMDLEDNEAPPNDDGLVDFPLDPDCQGPRDDNETS